MLLMAKKKVKMLQKKKKSILMTIIADNRFLVQRHLSAKDFLLFSKWINDFNSLICFFFAIHKSTHIKLISNQFYCLELLIFLTKTHILPFDISTLHRTHEMFNDFIKYSTYIFILICSI